MDNKKPINEKDEWTRAEYKDYLIDLPLNFFLREWDEVARLLYAFELLLSIPKDDRIVTIKLLNDHLIRFMHLTASQLAKEYEQIKTKEKCLIELVDSIRRGGDKDTQ